MPSAASWSELFHAMRLPYVRAPGSASSTSSGAFAASTSNMRLFVIAARSMSAESSVDLRMYVLDPCETATQPIRPTLKQKRVRRTFLFQPGDHLPFTSVFAVLSSCVVLILVMARSGIMRSGTGRQLDKLHAEGAAQNSLRFRKDGFESAAL